MSIESVMPSSHLILCHSLLLVPSIFPSIRVLKKQVQRTMMEQWSKWQWLSNQKPPRLEGNKYFSRTEKNINPELFTQWKQPLGMKVKSIHSQRKTERICHYLLRKLIWLSAVLSSRSHSLPPTFSQSSSQQWSTSPESNLLCSESLSLPVSDL